MVQGANNPRNIPCQQFTDVLEQGQLNRLKVVLVSSDCRDEDIKQSLLSMKVVQFNKLKSLGALERQQRRDWEMQPATKKEDGTAIFQPTLVHVDGKNTG